MANKIMVNLYGKEVALADIARYTNIDTSTLRAHYNKHKNIQTYYDIVLVCIQKIIFWNSTGRYIGNQFMSNADDYLQYIVRQITEHKEHRDKLVKQYNNKCADALEIGKKYGIDKATLQRYYTSTALKAQHQNVEWTMERAAQEILRKPQFMERLNNLGYVDNITKSRIENIYNNNHLIKSNTELLNMIRQDRLCDIPLRKELRKRCAEEGIAETSILPMLNKYKHLSLDEIIQGFKNKTLRRI